MKEIERDPIFRLDDIHDLTKAQLRERTMAKFSSLTHYVVNEKVKSFIQFNPNQINHLPILTLAFPPKSQLDVFTKRMELIGIADPAFWTRFGVHYGLFLGAIRSGATANQFSYWLEKGVLGLNGMVGCFGRLSFSFDVLRRKLIEFGM